MSEPASFDVIVVGGGSAGLSAALALGRATRRVLVASDGAPRNAPADAAHNVFTRDGTPPLELLRIGREQLEPYGVTIRSDRVVDARRDGKRFAVIFASGSQVSARGLILAIGMLDILPEIPGFQELWGSGVFHCPYCHGWEVARKPLGLYGRGDEAIRLSRLLRGWAADLVLFTDGPAELAPEDRAKIEKNGIVIREERIERLVGSGHLEAIVLAGGESVARAGLFIGPKLELRSDIAVRLGCQITPEGRIGADAVGRTSVPGVYVAGDAGPNPHAVSVAASTGMLAGVFLNHDLLGEEFEARVAGLPMP